MSKELIEKLRSEHTGEELAKALEIYADEITVDEYKVQLTPEERDEISLSTLDKMTEADTLDDDLKAYSKPIKAKVKDLRLEVKLGGKLLKAGYRKEQGKIFIFKDFENQTVTEISANGDIITDSRKMRAHEKQGNILNMKQKSA